MYFQYHLKSFQKELEVTHQRYQHRLLWYRRLEMAYKLLSCKPQYEKLVLEKKQILQAISERDEVSEDIDLQIIQEQTNTKGKKPSKKLPTIGKQKPNLDIDGNTSEEPTLESKIPIILTSLPSMSEQALFQDF